MTTGTDACGGALSLLAALQLADSAFPTGLFAASHGLETAVQEGHVRDAAGLETAVQEGHVRDAAGLERFVAGWLGWSVGPGDAVAVGAAAGAARNGDVDLLLQIDTFLAATRLPREGREASLKAGRQLLATATHLAGGPAGEIALLDAFAQAIRAGDTPGTHAVAFGAAAGSLGVPPLAAVLAELHAAASGILGAALRLLRVDHRQTQSILRRLAPRLEAIAGAAVSTDWRAMRPTAPLYDVLQMRHEGAHVRLFMS